MPLDPDKSRCASVDDDGNRCNKRPHREGLHVAVRPGGSLSWWTGRRVTIPGRGRAQRVPAEPALIAAELAQFCKANVMEIEAPAPASPPTLTLVRTPEKTQAPVPTRKASAKMQAISTAVAQGFTGEVCSSPECGSMSVLRTGACLTCQACGKTSSCG